MLSKFAQFSLKHKIVRGMISYGMLWPVGSLIEQTFVEKKNLHTYDWNKCLRFSLFGGLFMGPTLYIWMRLAAVMWPRTDVKSSLCKALTEQISYDPMIITTFLFSMSIMEGKTTQEAKREVSSKFFETYKVGVMFWPIVQTINFTFIPAHNQVVFTSFFSMLWTSFLAYMKYLTIETMDVDRHLFDIHSILHDIHL